MAVPMGNEDAERSGQIPPRDKGIAAEEGASEFIRKKGYRILRMNWRCRKGEIDIVAMDGDTLVFIEVKSRGSLSHGTPGEAVTVTKQRRIVAAATLCALHLGMEERAMRFDVVEVVGSGACARYQLWRSAFTPGGRYLPL